MEACERAAHGEKAFWAKGSAGVAAPCPTDTGQPPAGVNLLVLNVGDVAFLDSFSLRLRLGQPGTPPRPGFLAKS